MATLEQLEEGIRRAHAAGNADHVRLLGQAYRQMQGAQSAPVTQVDDAGVAVAPEGLRPGTREYADWAAANARAGNALPQVGEHQTTESSILDPFVQGVTFGWGDELRGAVQGGIAAAQGGDFGSAYDQVVDEGRNSLERERRVNPVGSFAAEVAGALPTAAMAGGQLAGRGATALARAGSGLLVGGSQGAAYGAGAADGDLAERASGGLTGAVIAGGIGAAAPFIGQAARRVVSPVPANASSAAAAKTLAREGVELTAGQRTGNRALQYMESELGGGAAADFMERQGEQFTQAVLKRAGISAKRATPDVIDTAFDTLGDQFDRMASVTRTRFDQPLRKQLLDIADDYLNTSGMPAPGVQNLIERIALLAKANNGVLTGRAYQNLRSKAGQLMRAADGPTRMAFQGIREALDDALERSTTGRTLEVWQSLRQRYQNLLVIEKAVTGAGANTASGLISPAQLRNAAIGQNRRSFARGGADYAELANAAVQAMTPLPQSGTAPRLAARGFGAVPAALGAAAGSPGGVLGAMAGAAAGAAIPAALGRAALSKTGRTFLSNQKATGTGSSAIEELIRRTGVPAYRSQAGASP